MKLVMIIASLLMSASAFGLGAFEQFDFTGAVHPAGANLANVCYDQGMLQAKVTKSDCVTTWVIDSEDQGNVFPHEYELTDEEWNAQGRTGKFGSFYTPEKTCTNTRTITKTIPMEKNVCLDWDTRWEEVDQQGTSDGKGLRLNSTCLEYGTAPLARSQRLDVVIVDIGETVFNGQNMGSAMYTIPDCPLGDDLPDTDVPDSKK